MAGLLNCNMQLESLPVDFRLFKIMEAVVDRHPHTGVNRTCSVTTPNAVLMYYVYNFMACRPLSQVILSGISAAVQKISICQHICLNT